MVATRCSSCGSRERMGVRECRKRPAVAERGALVALVSVMKSVPVGRHVGGSSRAVLKISAVRLLGVSKVMVNSIKCVPGKSGLSCTGVRGVSRTGEFFFRESIG